MQIVRSTQTRRSATPAGVMTTLASPAIGGAAAPLWKVEAAAGTAGPVHRIDAEQVWSVLEGGLTATVDGADAALVAGDTAVIPAGAERRIAPGPEGFTAVVTGPAGMRAVLPGSDEPVVPPWTV